MHNQSDSSVVILAAGFSSRMKQAKFSLMYDEQRTFLEKMVSEYIDFACKEIIVVINAEGIELKNKLNLSFPEHVKFVLNKYPERERFYSLQTGLKALQTCSNAFIQNSDNPFVNQDVLNALYTQKDEADFIVPTYEGKGGHPILMNTNIIKKISSEIKVDYNLKEYLKGFTKKTIPVIDDKIIININDVDTYENLFF